MKTEHSSLLCDTGLSEIELDRLGLRSTVERTGQSAVDNGRHPKFSVANTFGFSCWSPFDHWANDPDVRTLVRMVESGLFR